MELASDEEDDRDSSRVRRNRASGEDEAEAQESPEPINTDGAEEQDSGHEEKHLRPGEMETNLKSVVIYTQLCSLAH